MTLTTWRLPPPTTEQHVSERKYKKAAGVILHNQPVDLTHIGMIYYRTYSKRKNPLRPVVKKLMRDGYIRRAEDGFVIDGDVR